MEILYPANFAWMKFVLLSVVAFIVSFILTGVIAFIPFIDRFFSRGLPKFVARKKGLDWNSSEAQILGHSLVFMTIILIGVLLVAFVIYPFSIARGSNGWELDNDGNPHVEHFVIVKYDNVVHTRVTLKMISNGLLFEDYYLGPSCHGIALIKPDQRIPLNVERSVSPDKKTVMYDIVSNLQYALCPNP